MEYTISPENPDICVGDNLQLNVTYHGPNGDEPVDPSDVEWLSDAPSIFAITASGVLHGVAPGTGELTVTGLAGRPGSGSTFPNVRV